MADKFIIIDGNALVHRAFHALPPLSTKEGLIVNAVYGFTTILMRVLKEFKPEYIAVTFDLPKPTFRHEMYKEYKAKRIKQPQELYDQIPLIKEVVRGFNISVLEVAGFEADDLIATLTEEIEKTMPETEDIIVTGDMDTLQLVDKNTKVYSLKRGIGDIIIYDEKAVMARFGLVPSQMVDYKALRGDPSDNIPGVKGIGEKTAIELIKEYGSLENLYSDLEKGKTKDMRPKLEELLRDSKETAMFSKKLVELIKDVPLDISLDECRTQKPNIDKLRELFEKFEFRTLINRLEDKDNDQQLTPPAPPKPETKQMTFDELFKQVKKNDKLGLEIDEKNISLSVGQSFFSAPLSILENKKQRTAWGEILENKRVLKVGYDLKKIIKVLSNYGLSLSLPYFDIMIAYYLLYPGSRTTDLAQVAAGSNEEMRRSAETVLRLLPKLSAGLQKEGLMAVFAKIETPLVGVLAQMEEEGIKIDTKYLKKLTKDFQKIIDGLSKKIYKLSGIKFNISSPNQLREILFNKLKLVVPTGRIRKTPGGEISTSARELEKLRGAHPIVDLIFEHREFAKLRSTYTNSLINLIDKKDDRMHTTFNQAITSTGRLSSANPNLQNIPIRTEAGRKIRQAFVAELGNLLLAVDYSQIELRLAASLSGDQRMISAFKSGQDFHSQTASLVFGAPLDRVTKEMRRAAKAVNFGILYGMGPGSLAESTDLSRIEAVGFIKKYFQTFPKLRVYLDGLIDQARDLGFVETLFGRRRYLPEIVSGIPQVRAAAERMALNMPIQGTAADLMKMSMIQISEWIERCHCEGVRQLADDEAIPIINGIATLPRKRSGSLAMTGCGIHLLLQVHDELIFEVKKDMIARAVKKIKAIMENIYSLRVPLVAEASAGRNWGEMEVIK